MNYLLLRALKLYYYEDLDVKLMYNTLRENILKNIGKNWDHSHDFWENYDSFSGLGKGFRSFTGWTSLVVLIYSEEY
jgi:mannosyl-oligosaccharide glucosidase